MAILITMTMTMMMMMRKTKKDGLMTVLTVSCLSNNTLINKE